MLWLSLYLTGTSIPLVSYCLLVPNQVQVERQRRNHRYRKTDIIDAIAIAALLA